MTDIRGRKALPEILPESEPIATALFGQHGHADPRDRGAPTIGRRADVVIGPPAAGKSTALVEPLLKQHGGVLIDADEAKTMLPGYDNGLGANAVHEASAYIAERLLRDKVVGAGANFVQPIVGKNLKKVDELLKSYAEAGYEVHLHFVELPIEKALQRALTRYIETGRLLDPAYISGIDHLPAKAFDELKSRPYVRSYEKVSTDVPFGEPPIVTERGGSLEDANPGLGRAGADHGAGNHEEAQNPGLGRGREEEGPLALGEGAPRGWDTAEGGYRGYPAPGRDLGPFLPQPDVPLGAQAQDYVLGRGRVTGNEHLVAIDKNGSVDAHVEGNPRSVYIPPALNEHFYNPSKGI
ncbi:MAG: zeta toxin family protein, partial [Cyanobacteria bacterium REEB65]|nr:zeta toxin family protein [Cyanobacteria bacterium REEB65]